MPRFDYHAVDDEQRPHQGSVEAASLAGAVVEIEAAGLTIRSIAQADETPSVEELAKPTEPALVAAVERVLAQRDQFLEPLTAYARELPLGKRRRELKTILETIAAGSSEEATKAAAADPLAWGPLLSAASAEGDDDRVFARFVAREQPRTTLRRHRGSAMAYPLLILGVTLLVGWPIATFLLPSFSDIYASFGLELPAFTLFILAVGNFLARGGGLAILGLTAALFVAWVSLPWWAPTWLVRLKGSLAARGEGASIASARLTRAAADLVEAGLPSPLVLETVGKSIGGFIGDRANRLAPQITKDAPPLIHPSAVKGSLAFAFEQEMPAASRATLLRELSVSHEERAVGRFSWAQGFAGPVATIAVGLAVGAIVLALFLPLVRLIEGLT